eukprot:2919964-Rhodomonas_salina.3
MSHKQNLRQSTLRQSDGHPSATCQDAKIWARTVRKLTPFKHGFPRLPAPRSTPAFRLSVRCSKRLEKDGLASLDSPRSH